MAGELNQSHSQRRGAHDQQHQTIPFRSRNTGFATFLLTGTNLAHCPRHNVTNLSARPLSKWIGGNGAAGTNNINILDVAVGAIWPSGQRPIRLRHRCRDGKRRPAASRHLHGIRLVHQRSTDFDTWAVEYFALGPRDDHSNKNNDQFPAPRYQRFGRRRTGTLTINSGAILALPGNSGIYRLQT